ncbi:MAG: Protein-arginine kinase activator protein [Syntrophomonadaceae bacterium]|nr:Protein-arginine kinase activator protein [Bacillota bacterium]
MKCEACGKNTATVHYTEIINEELREMHLCEWCAQQKEALVKPHFFTAEFLSGLFDASQVFTEKQTEKCAQCGFGHSNFQKLGRLGCSECYQTFKEQITPLLKRVHGSSQHVGNVPSAHKGIINVRKDLSRLRQELKTAISEEKFEEAARLRDKIKEIEKNITATEKSDNESQ